MTRWHSHRNIRSAKFHPRQFTFVLQAEGLLVSLVGLVKLIIEEGAGQVTTALQEAARHLHDQGILVSTAWQQLLIQQLVQQLNHLIFLSKPHAEQAQHAKLGM